MLVIAVFPLVVLAAQPLGNISYWLPVVLIGIGASAHQAWSANLYTTVSDMFSQKGCCFCDWDWWYGRRDGRCYCE